ncbi:histamine N-methyltransferase-like [Boleophthalmus pectinirostris]|uniref:histamine N-methyltransferase-like n=1 Tax=Boleophthalmus pectinirostris TaxID=150288 RepID=UPI00242DE493|nr:histamine N-methyltransferase-like [Boleophthalmus pectinirostris]
MASPLKSLVDDDDGYDKSLTVYKVHSSGHQPREDFIRTILPEQLASIGDGKSINIIGLGAGEGNIDMEMLSQLRRKHPGVLLDNEVVEPSAHRILRYKERAAQMFHLDPVNFTWNQMTASEFEEQWRQRNITKKIDFIHMLHMLYYVEDPGATVRFYQSLLRKNGKILISILSAESGYVKMWKAFSTQLNPPGTRTWFPERNTADIKQLLDEAGIQYQSYKSPAVLDITDCFTEGNEAGELILNFLTETVNFRKTAPQELRDGVLRTLRDPQCCTEKNGRILLNKNEDFFILEASD